MTPTHSYQTCIIRNLLQGDCTTIVHHAQHTIPSQLLVMSIPRIEPVEGVRPFTEHGLRVFDGEETYGSIFGAVQDLDEKVVSERIALLRTFSDYLLNEISVYEDMLEKDDAEESVVTETLGEWLTKYIDHPLRFRRINIRRSSGDVFHGFDNEDFRDLKISVLAKALENKASKLEIGTFELVPYDTGFKSILRTFTNA